MKLSEAMMLGSTTCKMVPHDINSCALGAALNAIGVPLVVRTEINLRYRALIKAWPWTYEIVTSRLTWASETHCYRIAVEFDRKVCSGLMTLEQLVDYVRTIEPDCGECNNFTCTCVTSHKSSTQPVEEACKP